MSIPKWIMEQEKVSPVVIFTVGTDGEAVPLKKEDLFHYVTEVESQELRTDDDRRVWLLVALSIVQVTLLAIIAFGG